jgi:hypothetical protein
MASIVSRPRRAVDRNTTSPRSLSAGASRLASVPDGIPGATLPTTATAHSWPWWATKMPSTVRPPATGRREGHRAAFVEGRDRMPARNGRVHGHAQGRAGGPGDLRRQPGWLAQGRGPGRSCLGRGRVLQLQPVAGPRPGGRRRLRGLCRRWSEPPRRVRGRGDSHHAARECRGCPARPRSSGHARALPQSGERATPGSRIALGHHLDNPPSGREEDSLGRGPAEHRGEECDLALGVDGSDNRERFHAESLERAASWRGLPRGRDPLDARGFRPREERKQEQDEERPSVWRSCLSSWPPRPRRSPCASSSRGACYCRVGATLSCTPDLTHANCRQRCLRSPVRRLVLAREARLLELGVRRLSLDRSATRRAIHLDDARDSTLRPYRGRCQGQAGGGRSCRD